MGSIDGVNDLAEPNLDYSGIAASSASTKPFHASNATSIR